MRTNHSATGTSTQIVLAARPFGEPKDSDFELKIADLPEMRDGQVLLRVIYLSLDPYMRGRMSSARSYAEPLELGDVIVGATVCEVVASRADSRAPGDLVLADAGWQTHAVVEASKTTKLDPNLAPVSTALGVLGMPGFAAYAGLLEIGRPKPGETLVVAAATGAVGSAVGQIAKVKGARTVGIAGGAEKCRALIEDFGFDAAVDHRHPAFVEELAKAVPHGVDIYFENVGGQVTDAVWRHLNQHARIPVCGLIAAYNATERPEGPDRRPAYVRSILIRSLTVRGFIQSEFLRDHHEDFLRQMSGWLRDGSVRYREDIVRGLEHAPGAFRGLLSGRNFGKLLVQVG